MTVRIQRVLETALYCDDLQRTAAFYQRLLSTAPLLSSERLVAFDAGAATVMAARSDRPHAKKSFLILNPYRAFTLISVDP